MEHPHHPARECAPAATPDADSGRLYRVEGRLVAADVVRQALFFVSNTQGLKSRIGRISSLAITGSLYPLLRGTAPHTALRLMYSALRGVSRDRLEFLGAEYFEREMKPRLRPRLVAELQEQHDPILASSWLDHVIRPLARHLGVTRCASNRLEFRDGICTGRLIGPLLHRQSTREAWTQAVRSVATPLLRQPHALLTFAKQSTAQPLSVRDSLAGKHILLLGVTGFIGKVWLANLLRDRVDVAKVSLLIRRRGRSSAQKRYETTVLTAPPLAGLPESDLAKIEVLEGDAVLPDMGLRADEAAQLKSSVDVIVNSAGVTEFNPDLRLAVAINVDATLATLQFVRESTHAALLHLSTCFVAGTGHGRIPEHAGANYTPASDATFDAEREYVTLRRLIAEVEEEATHHEPPPRRDGRALNEAQKKKAQQRWLRGRLAEVGAARARTWGWPNTYTFTKSLAESLLQQRGADVPVAIVRPSIVETSTDHPFPGWNEGVNTSAPLSYLLQTSFRQLPTRQSKRLDVVPVDLVTRGMTLIAAALVERRHERCYQLATSASNPCDMRRSIELTALAHRKHYRDRPGFSAWWRTHNETVPVSRRRYRALSVPRQQKVVDALQRALPFMDSLKRVARQLDKTQKLIELYEPFIHDNEQIFEADHIGFLNAALPQAERATFGYDAADIDWPEYWIDIHIPALRRWAYPLIEGRPVQA